MTNTTIIDLITTRLAAGAGAYPDWTVRCTWADEADDKSDRITFHAAPDERSAVGLARFVLDRYQNLNTRNLKRAEIHRPDGFWENVPRPTSRLTTPVWFAFPRLPRRPG